MKQGTAVQSEHITSGINERHFISSIKEMFSSSTVALGEIAQNARRAGATFVSFEYGPLDDTMVVTDNGCGVEDFSKLIVIAESGWSDETIATENPFGIGFMSVCFCARSVTVESKGKSVSFTADDLVEKRPIPVVSCGFIGGTRLTLNQVAIDHHSAHRALRRIARAFPIDVRFNGETLECLHAQKQMAGCETAVGFVSITGIHCPRQEWLGFGVRGSVYCQGLPVRVSPFTMDNLDMSYTDIVVHVDPLIFRPRVPDRDCLIDQEKAADAIRDVVVEIVRKHLESEKAIMSAKDFSTAYWHLASSVGLVEVMNDVPYLPKHHMYTIGGPLGLNSDGISCWQKREEGVTKEEVESGKVTLIANDLCEEFCADNFARMAVAKEDSWILIEQLPEHHWANAYLVDIDSLPCHIDATERGSTNFYGNYVGGEIRLVDDVKVTLGSRSVIVHEAIAIDEGSREVLLVPMQDDSPENALYQISTYIDSNDCYDDDARVDDVRNFLNIVAALKGEAPNIILSRLLKQTIVSKIESLRGKAFRIDVDASGKYEVSLIQ